ncbi:hypothetical protein [Streptococcus parauberis]|uniref:hypothetical protein n=1 Tax=Streptococcus parauberis TaxID=1348 RepID=UPI0037B374D0
MEEKTKKQLIKQAKFKVELYFLILDLIRDRSAWMTLDQQIKIVGDIYKDWSLEDINITLEAINENLCK